MNFKLLRFILLISFSNLSFSIMGQTYQEFPNEQSQWEIIRCFYFFQAGWHDIYNIEMDGTDTLYNGNNYKKLFITQHLKHGVEFDSIYPKEFFGGFREENKQIYIFQKWASIDTTEHLVYDFNKTDIGDIIYTSCLAGPSDILFPHVVMETDSVQIGDSFHKRILLEDPDNPNNWEYWIEGVGSSWGLPFASFWSITDNSYDISCFYNKQGLAYTNSDPQFSYCIAPLPEIKCDSLISSGKELEVWANNIEVFPNPAQTHFNIKGISASDLKSIWIINQFGQKLFSLDPQINSIYRIEGISPGIYYIQFHYQGGYTSRKLVIL